MAWCLSFAGVMDVRILDRTFDLSQCGGVPTSDRDEPRQPRKFFADLAEEPPFPVHPEFLASTSRVRGIVQDRAAALVDVRSWDEFSKLHLWPRGRVYRLRI